MILLPILLLFAVGFLITLNSGTVTADAREGTMKVVAENFSAMLLRFFGYFAAILAVQQVIGSPSLLGW
jgi:hypothetical protein